MADQKISELTAITGANTADDDLLVIVDTSTGETKKITLAELEAGIARGSYVGDLTGNVTGDLTGESTLPALSASISDTAVDVFVYDTRKDSDGGAWRKRTQHTSWYNETLNTATRGARREFPAVAVIVAEATQVTIYDGDDPDLPMWMVFSCYYTGSYSAKEMLFSCNTSVSMANGMLTTSGNASWKDGATSINFISESASRYGGGGKSDWKAGGIVTRNTQGGYTGVDNTSKAIISSASNDIAMTVLPNAPIDPATQLPIPTIAVATDGGVSVIKDDGSVVDSLSTSAKALVDFTKDNFLLASNKSSANIFLYGYADNWASDGFNANTYSSSNGYPIIPASFHDDGLVGIKDTLYSASTNGGLIKTYWEPAELDYSGSVPYSGAIAYITSTYNTGWMNGDIKLATLSDTDATNVTGTELVTNGTFDTDTSGWSAGNGATLSVASGQLRVNANGNNFGGAYQLITTEANKTYTLTVDVGAITNASDFYVLVRNTTISGTTLKATLVSANTSYAFTFTAISGTTAILFESNNDSDSIFDVDNISVRLAEEDRSVNGNGLQVFGTVTKTPVATGADLVAYSGFSTSNYLQQPYNSDLDFGTGDFCVMGWVKVTTGSVTNSIVSRNAVSGSVTDGDILFRILSDNKLAFYIRTSGAWTSLATTSAVNTQVWLFVCATRVSGVTYLYVNGQSSATPSSALTGSVSGGTLVVGMRAGYSVEYLRGDLALFRISATAPTAEQIKTIYESEKHLFTEGAKCTLTGTSDAVTALAYDSDTDLLHVGSSSGRSVFSGLRRVDETATAVTTSISASNGMVVEQ